MSELQEGQLTDEKLSDGELTQEQLALLNNLMYLGDITDYKNRTIGYYLDEYAEDNYKKVNSLPDGVADTSHEDWKAIINTIQNDEKLKNMTIASTLEDDQKASAICLVSNTSDTNKKATCVFRGTGKYEWLDNGTGCDIADTEQQKEALDWINSLGYNDITASGHSKGGNKAQYLGIVSDKVKRSVAFDGQGFSEEFCEKYKDRIAAKKDTITLICSQGDYVNGLFFDIAGNIVYTKSHKTDMERLIDPSIADANSITNIADLVFNIIKIGQEHSATTFLTTKDGKVQFREVADQDPLMKLTHQYIEYFTKNASKEDKEYFCKLVMNQLQGKAQKIDIGIGDAPGGFWGRFSDLFGEWTATLNITAEQKAKIMFFLANKKADSINSIFSDIANQSYKTMIPSLDNTIRDFSMEAKERLIASINNVEGDNPLNFKVWPQWDELDLNIKAMLELRGINLNHSYINAYYSELVEKNDSSIDKINNIFEKVYQIDSDYNSKLKEQCEKLKHIEITIKTLKERFNTSSIDVDISALKVN